MSLIESLKELKGSDKSIQVVISERGLSVMVRRTASRHAATQVFIEHPDDCPDLNFEIEGAVLSCVLQLNEAE